MSTEYQRRISDAEYKRMALMTESRPPAVNMGAEVLLSLLKIGYLAGELLDDIKKVAFYGSAKVTPATTMSKMEDLTAQVTKTFRLIDEDAKLRDDFERHEDGTVIIPGLAQEIAINNKLAMDERMRRLLHASVGIFTEGGEMLKPFIDYLESGEFDAVNFGEEMGDIMWYQAIGEDACGVSEAKMKDLNNAKLMARYKGKGFTSEAANNRDLAVERAKLEE